MGRIKDAIFGSDDASESFADELAPATARGALVGHITLRRSGEVVVELVTNTDLDFRPSDISIVFDDGGSSPTKIDEAKTTRSGLISAGSTIRIVLGFSASFDKSIITAIEITTPSGPLVIQIGD